MTHPKGYLFIGPPGTGKTLLAQAVAGEAKVNLICLSASEIQKQIDIGTRIGAIRLRNLFEQARKNTPCILFLDEIDAIGRARNESMDLKLFTEFLIQMDSFSVKDGFIVIGTTNFLSSLDSAFVRSGRFDRIIGLNYPSRQTRIAILKLYTKKQGFDNSISWNYFGKITKGFSAADLSKVVNESSLYLIEKKFIQPTQGRLSNLQSPVPLGTGALDTGVGVEQVRTSSQELTKRLFSRTIVNIFIQYLNFLVPSFFKPSRNSLVHTTSSLERGIERISNS
jgi:ATP-dependent 26S proteasome regulatory subunit